MSAAQKRSTVTLEEYFAIEERAERKSEYYNGEMFLMAGASREHNIIARNLSFQLQLRLQGTPCGLFIADQRVRVQKTGLYTYPDMLIVCGTPEYAPENRDTLINPKVVIEILSDSTERYNRTTKFRHYKKLPSVQEYVLVSQDEPLVERFTRQDDGAWGQMDFVGLDVEMVLATVPVSIPMADVFRGVEFPERPDAPFSE
jgi:Uma2 family endonuclease